MTRQQVTEAAVQVVTALIDQIYDTAERTVQIERDTRKPGLTLQDICDRYLHRSINYAYARPWLQPNFGVPDLPGRPAVWFEATCNEWFSVSMDVRKAQYYRRIGHQEEQSA